MQNIEKLIALILLFLLSPVLIILILCILIEGIINFKAFGTPFYFERRISQGKPFQLIKFRTFYPSAKKELIGTKLEKYGISAIENKPENVTLIGKFLRKFYLDELPQLVNIIKGEMRFVGPRPLIEALYKQHCDNGNFAKTKLIAGWTGPWQINKGYVDGLASIIALENQYAEDVEKLGNIRRFSYDFKIVILTFKTLWEAKSI